MPAAPYCRPELAAQAEAIARLPAREADRGRRLGARHADVREPDGSYTTFDDLVCGERRDGGRGGAGQMIHEYFLAH